MIIRIIITAFYLVCSTCIFSQNSNDTLYDCITNKPVVIIDNTTNIIYNSKKKRLYTDVNFKYGRQILNDSIKHYFYKEYEKGCISASIHYIVLFKKNKIVNVHIIECPYFLNKNTIQEIITNYIRNTIGLWNTRTKRSMFYGRLILP